MIQSLTLKNFRNFSHKELFFSQDINFIYGENGHGKSNCIEAFCLLLGSELFGIDLDLLVKQGEKVFFIEARESTGKVFSLSYDRETKKKKILLGGKPTTKQKLLLESTPYVVFHPLLLNLMYLTPTIRREYLDGIITQVFPLYDTLLKQYKTVIRNRNKLLQSIGEGKSQKSEISFWNEEFLNLAEKIYTYRFHIVEFFETHIGKYHSFFQGKIQEVQFIYKIKADRTDVRSSMKSYLEKNFERDIILASTSIGPHIDDFDILLDGVSLTDFASRGETKTLILGLKTLETIYIEENTKKKPILLIDDFLSEIDDIHKKMILDTFSPYQTIITSISPLSGDEDKNIIVL